MALDACLRSFGFGCVKMEPRHATVSLHQPADIPQALRRRGDKGAAQVCASLASTVAPINGTCVMCGGGDSGVL